MKWNRYTLKTKSEAEDIVISTLADIGIQGVEIEDKQPLTQQDKEQMFCLLYTSPSPRDRG